MTDITLPLAQPVMTLASIRVKTPWNVSDDPNYPELSLSNYSDYNSDIKKVDERLSHGLTGTMVAKSVDDRLWSHLFLDHRPCLAQWVIAACLSACFDVWLAKIEPAKRSNRIDHGQKKEMKDLKLTTKGKEKSLFRIIICKERKF